MKQFLWMENSELWWQSPGRENSSGVVQRRQMRHELVELGSYFNIIIFLIIIYNRLKYSKEKKIWSPWTKHMIRNSTALTLSTIIPSILKWTKCIHQNLNWNNNPTILRSAKLTCSWSSSPRLMSWSYLTPWTCWQTPSWLSTLFRHGPWTTMILVHQFKYKV